MNDVIRSFHRLLFATVSHYSYMRLKWNESRRERRAEAAKCPRVSKSKGLIEPNFSMSRDLKSKTCINFPLLTASPSKISAGFSRRGPRIFLLPQGLWNLSAPLSRIITYLRRRTSISASLSWRAEWDLNKSKMPLRGDVWLRSVVAR